MRLMRLEMRACGDFVMDACGAGTVTVRLLEAEAEAGWQRGH